MKLVLPALGLAAVAIALGGCGGPPGYPSLQPRAIERAAADPAPAAAEAEAAAPDAELGGRAAAPLAQALEGERAFQVELAAARTAAAAPGARTAGSEAWVAAQQALTRVDAAREPVGRALADLDRLRLEAISGGRPAPAIDAAWSRVAAIAATQDEAYRTLATELPAG